MNMNTWLTPQLLEFARKSPHLPALELRASDLAAIVDRRKFLSIASAGVLLSGIGTREARAAMVFENGPKSEPVASSALPSPSVSQQLQLGEVPADFWDRPRTLRLKRHETGDLVETTYWKDGNLVEDGYWQACALLRDVKANRMTTMDPMVLDILRGIQGYYDAWKWQKPLMVSSGFRTAATNRALLGEGAAKNSMHLYGKAADCYMQGINPANIARLAQHMQSGGVGFYPSKNFVHVDTGKKKYWKS